MEIDLFGIKFGGNSHTQSGRQGTKTYTKHEIKLNEFCEALGINGKVTYCKYDYNTRKIYITEELED